MMLTPEDRDAKLFELYNSRRFLIFFHGEEWFNTQVREIHRQWYTGGGFGGCTIDPTYSLEQMCWEMDNNIPFELD